MFHVLGCSLFLPRFDFRSMRIRPPVRPLCLLILVSLWASVWAATGQGQWSWKPVATGVEASFRGLHAVSDRAIWASGSQGTVLLSRDAGETWQIKRIPGFEAVELRSLHAWNEREAIVATAGQPCAILKTSDGGEHWREVHRVEHPKAFIDGMKFANDRMGIVVGDPIDGHWMLLKSDDSGERWTAAANPPVAALDGEAAFAASNSSLLALSPDKWLLGTGGNSGHAQILLSRDAGQHWERSEVPGILRHESAGIFSLGVRRDAGKPAATWIAVGGDYKQPTLADKHIALSTDEGGTWRSPTGQPPRGFRSCVVWVPEGTGPTAAGPLWITVGTDGSEWSADGDDWKPLGNETWHAISVSPEGTVWVSGGKGRIGKLVRTQLK